MWVLSTLTLGKGEKRLALGTFRGNRALRGPPPPTCSSPTGPALVLDQLPPSPLAGSREEAPRACLALAPRTPGRIPLSYPHVPRPHSGVMLLAWLQVSSRKVDALGAFPQWPLSRSPWMGTPGTKRAGGHGALGDAFSEVGEQSLHQKRKEVENVGSQEGSQASLQTDTSKS